MKTCFINTLMTLATQAPSAAGGKPATEPPRSAPPARPLPSPTLDPAKLRLHLGLDVHLESIMAVA
jgi:hypothetical protein